MARYFLEMEEELTEQEARDGVQPVFIRIPVIDKNDAIIKKPTYSSIFDGLNYKSTFHTCPHPGNSCTEEEI